MNRLKENYTVILECMIDMSLDILHHLYLPQKMVSLSAERKNKLERPYPDEVCFLNEITILELICHW